MEGDEIITETPAVEVSQPDLSTHEGRTEAATSLFKDDGTVTPEVADPNAVDPAADPAIDPAVDPNAPPALTDEQLQADPKFQELSQFRDEVQPIFDKYGIPDSKEAELQLADASILYDIAKGNGSAAQLMETFLQVWPKESVDKAAQDLIGWLSQKGYLKAGEGTAPKEAANPALDKVTSIERRLNERDQQDLQAKETERRTKVFSSFETKVLEFAKGKNIDPEDAKQYVVQIASEIKGNQAVIGRIEKGNFVDVQKMFDTLHNAEMKRFNNFQQKQLAEQRRKAGNPRVSSGGAPPAPAAQQRANFADRDARLAAATEIFRGN